MKSREYVKASIVDKVPVQAGGQALSEGSGYVLATQRQCQHAQMMSQCSTRDTTTTSLRGD